MTHISEQFTHPVYCRIEIRIIHCRIIVRYNTIGLFSSFNILRRIKQLSFSIHIGFICSIHVCVSIGQLRFLCQCYKSFVIVGSKLRLTYYTRFCLNKNNAIGTTHTIYRCCRCIFQDSKRLDVFWVDIIKATFNSIYQHQRRRILVSKCRNTTNPNIRIIMSGFTGTLNSYHSG